MMQLFISQEREEWSSWVEEGGLLNWTLDWKSEAAFHPLTSFSFIDTHCPFSANMVFYEKQGLWFCPEKHCCEVLTLKEFSANWQHLTLSKTVKLGLHLVGYYTWNKGVLKISGGEMILKWSGLRPKKNEIKTERSSYCCSCCKPLTNSLLTLLPSIKTHWFLWPRSQKPQKAVTWPVADSFSLLAVYRHSST